jgi:hypothetical protein
LDPGVHARDTHLELSVVGTQTVLLGQGVLTKESRSGEQVERSGSAGPPSHRDSPGAQTGSAQAPVALSQTSEPAHGSVDQPAPSAEHTDLAAVPGLPVHLAAPGSQPSLTLAQAPVAGSHADPVGHAFSNHPLPSARHTS